MEHPHSHPLPSSCAIKWTAKLFLLFRSISVCACHVKCSAITSPGACEYTMHIVYMRNDANTLMASTIHILTSSPKSVLGAIVCVYACMQACVCVRAGFHPINASFFQCFCCECLKTGVEKVNSHHSMWHNTNKRHAHGIISSRTYSSSICSRSRIHCNKSHSIKIYEP